MAIKILITLEGSEEVKSSLNEMAKSGEAFMQQFEGLSAKAPLAELSSGLEKAKPVLESTNQITHGFAESLRVVLPSLRLAGVEVGNFAGFARLATAGIEGLAIAIGGAIVVALARLEDTARTTKGQLEDLFQSKTLGEKAFAGAQASAKEFNTTIASVIPGIEALTIAWERFVNETRTFKFVAPTGGEIGQIIPPGMTGSIESLQTAYNNFLKLLRAGRLDQANAEKAAEAFFKAMQNGGKLTADILRTLPVGTINLIAQAMGRGQISTQQFINEVKLAPIAMDKLVEAFNRFTLESDAAFRANAIITYKDKLGEILNTLSEGFSKIAGIKFSDFVIKQLEGINKGIKDTIAEFEKLKALLEWIEQHTEIPFIGPITQKLREGAAAIGIPGTGAAPPEPNTEEINRVWEAAGVSAKERFIKGWRDAPAAAADIGKTFKDDLDKAAQQIEPAIDQFTKGLNLTGPTGILPSWEEFLDILKKIPPLIKNIPSNIISPAGAAEFTGGPLLQQQQQIEQQQQQAAQTQPLVTPFQEADNQIRTIWIDLLDYISTSLTDIDFTPLTQALVAPFTNALPGIRDALLQVENMIREIVRQALEAGQIIQQLNQGGRPGGGGGRGFIEIASGGHVRGPGTTTSDSIPAWLSNREYVIQARAVDHYGANLFAALNAMRLPKDHFSLSGLAKALAGILPRHATGGMATAAASADRFMSVIVDSLPRDIFPRFQVGGLVLPNFKAPSPAPHFATGGSPTSGGATRSLTIVLDNQRFGLNGSADVIDKLERVATMAGIASIGRPPGWVR